jgi:ATP/maltotriose-dependent transcriptional regulator MalT
MFRHDVVREITYESIPGPDRAAWHRIAADIAVEDGRSAIEAAEHLVRSGPGGGRRAVALLRQAAAECRAVAPLTAATYLAHALVTLDPQDPLWSDVCAEAVGLLASTRRVEEARRWGEQALQRSDLAPEIRANLLLGLAFGAKQAGHNRMAVEYVDWALGLRSVSHGVRAKLYGLKAHALLYLDYGAGADEAGKRACRTGRVSGEYGACALGYTARSVVAQFEGRLDTALALAEAAVDAADAHGGTVVHRHPKLWRGIAFVALDRFDDGAADYKAAFRESDRLHTKWLHSPLQFHRAHLWVAQGLLDDAMTEAEAGLVPEPHDDTEQLFAPLHGLLATIAVQRGQMLTARKHLRQMTRVLARGITVAPELIAWPHAVFHDANGQPRLALREMAEVLRQAPGRLLLFSHAPEAAPELVRMAIAVGDHAVAKHVADAARFAADRNRSVVSLAGAALHAEALLHQDLGRFTEAAECLDPSPRRLLRAAALCDAARAGYRTARSEAVESLEKALHLYQMCGAHRGIAHVHNLRRVVGVSTPADGGGSEVESRLDRLTPAQQEIARLVPERRSNRAIADRLDMPEGTVRTHMQEIYRRLGIHSRPELIRIVRAEENGA